MSEPDSSLIVPVHTTWYTNTDYRWHDTGRFPLEMKGYYARDVDRISKLEDIASSLEKKMKLVQVKLGEEYRTVFAPLHNDYREIEHAAIFGVALDSWKVPFLRAENGLRAQKGPEYELLGIGYARAEYEEVYGDRKHQIIFSSSLKNRFTPFALDVVRAFAREHTNWTVKMEVEVKP